MKKYEAISIPDRISVHAIVAVLKTKFIVSSEQKEKNGDGDTHDFPEILFVNRGRCRMRVSDEVYDLADGDMIMYSPMARHSRVGDADADISIISFMADAVCLSPLFNRVIRLDHDRRDTLAKIVERGVSVYERRYSDSEIGGMVIRDGVGDFEVQKVKKGFELFLLDLLSDLGASEHRVDNYRLSEFLAVRDFLLKNTHRHLSVAEITRACSMSESKLKMLVRDFAGVGVIDYFLLLRIDEAKRLISAGGMNFTEISETLGFSSLYYFSRIFKSRAGVSPSEYAKNVNN